MKIDKAVCLCLNQRWNERKTDIYNMKERSEAIGADFQIFMAESADYDPVVSVDMPPIDYKDVPKANLSREIAGWGYGNAHHKHNHWNALKCHKIILSQCIKEGRENVLMIEDDAYFTSRFEEVWEQIQSELDSDTFPIIYLGWWVGEENDEFNKNFETKWQKDGIINIVKVRQVGGLHGAIIQNEMFEFLLGLPDNNPIDAQLNILGAHNQLKTILIAPKLIHTRSTFSYCEGNIIERLNI